MSEHERVRDALLERELGDDALEDDAHLAECEECRSLAEALRSVDASFGELPSMEVPPELVQRTLQRVEADRPGVFALLVAVASALLAGLLTIPKLLVAQFRWRRAGWVVGGLATAGAFVIALFTMTSLRPVMLGGARHAAIVDPEPREAPEADHGVALRGELTEDRIALRLATLDDGYRRQVSELGYAPGDDHGRNTIVDTPDPLNVDGRFRETPRTDFWEDDDGEPDRDEAEAQFVEPRGYWANTYTPADPTLRALRLSLSGQPLALAQRAEQSSLAIDPPSHGALALELYADRSASEGHSRMLLSIGLRGTHARGRPPTLATEVVIDARTPLDESARARIRALLSELSEHRQPSDRIGVIVTGPGGGELVPVGELRFGELSIALRRLEQPSGPVLALPDALRTAIRTVGASTEVSSALVLVVTPSLHDDDAVALAQVGALGGVTTTAIGLSDDPSLDQLALAGHGRRRVLASPSDAAAIVRGEAEAMSRVVARAVRVHIRLAPGVSLVGVLGSRRLDDSEMQQARQAEQSIDTELARALGIVSDRGSDEDGMQIVIPAFYADDEHAIVLDLMADAGPIADVSLRYKDLVELENATANERFTLAHGASSEGPRERTVREQQRAYQESQAFTEAATLLDQANTAGARAALQRVPTCDLCAAYAAAIDSASDPRSLASSLRYASYRRRNGDPLDLR